MSGHVDMFIALQGKNFSFSGSRVVPNRQGDLDVIWRCSTDTEIGIVLAESFTDIVFNQSRKMGNLKHFWWSLPLAQNHHPV